MDKVFGKADNAPFDARMTAARMVPCSHRRRRRREEFAVEVNPAAIASMAERGIDISREFPKPWTDEIVRAADVVVTMGCGDTCPICPGKRYLDWDLNDPAGKPVEEIRPIRDEVERRVRALPTELSVPVS